MLLSCEPALASLSADPTPDVALPPRALHVLCRGATPHTHERSVTTALYTAWLSPHHLPPSNNLCNLLIDCIICYRPQLDVQFLKDEDSGLCSQGLEQGLPQQYCPENVPSGFIWRAECPYVASPGLDEAPGPLTQWGAPLILILNARTES